MATNQSSFPSSLLLALTSVGVVYGAYAVGRKCGREVKVTDSQPALDDSVSDFVDEESVQKVLIISGATKGIGLKTAELFAKRGWTIINISRSVCPLPESVTIKANLGQIGWEIDVENFLKEFFNSNKKYRICLVHNAAALTRDSALSVDATEFRRILEINVVAPTILNRVVSPYLQKNSSILYIGSTLSEKGVAQSASYVSSKHAVAGLMKVTCQDLKGRDIHTVCICPGFTSTDMVVEHFGSNPNFKDEILSKQVMGRIIEPQEISSVVLFCAENPCTNGAVFHCNLGQVEK